MKTILTSAAVAAAVALFSTGAQAADELALAKSKNCTACHSVDKKLIGPAYKDVAAKYKDDKEAEARLIGHVRKGSVGVWGKVPMPANPQVKDDEAKRLVQWVLSL